MLNLKVHGVKEADVTVANIGVVKDDKGLIIAVMDKDGKPLASGQLVRLTNEGTLVRLKGLSDKLGFQMNQKGQILEITKNI